MTILRLELRKQKPQDPQKTIVVEDRSNSLTATLEITDPMKPKSEEPPPVRQAAVQAGQFPAFGAMVFDGSTIHLLKPNVVTVGIIQNEREKMSTRIGIHQNVRSEIRIGDSSKPDVRLVALTRDAKYTEIPSRGVIAVGTGWAVSAIREEPDQPSRVRVTTNGQVNQFSFPNYQPPEEPIVRQLAGATLTIASDREQPRERKKKIS